ncbi:MAG: hypothetical protein IPL49_06990 [Saprospirales bacterium]|nr:hypothetical protein [Saprospirales bacterium]
MKFFSDLFASFDQQDSLVFLLFVLVSFLIGFLLSWLVASRKNSKLREEAQKAQAEFKALDAEYQSFKEQFELREADLQHAQVEVEEAKRRMQNFQDESRRLKAELEETHAELIRMESAVTSQQVTIEDLNDQILGLRTKNQQLAEESVELPPKVEALALEPIDAVAEMQSAFNAALQRLATIEEKLQQIESENTSMRNQFAASPTSRSLEASVEQLFEIDEEEDDEAIVARAREYLNSAIGSVLPASSESEKDDLKKIEGIGTFIEKQLNEAGIYTYEQISKLDEVLIEQLTTAIQFFPGRIVKDDWVGQAAQLLNQTQEEKKEAQPGEDPPSANQVAESLQVVEGIGPKIETLLNEAGISSLQDLADAKGDHLQEILSSAGERFRLHDPSTWPEQARLAAAGEWEQLNTFKEYLNGGKHPE